MRGKVHKIQAYDLCNRITPAYAGKSTPVQERVPKRQDHPRLCGEKVPVTCPTLIVSGSPPPMRGKVRSRSLWGCWVRITPAYAGKSCYRNLIAVDPRDHPRLCGEKAALLVQQGNEEGSPPPMRGKVQLAVQPRTTFWDHPRLCGEKISHALFIMLAMGSPPPMRGKGGFAPRQASHLGITPAYAGKSKNISLEMIVILGSPPPMRGKE